MKTRLVCLNIALCCVLSCAVIGQGKWKSIASPQWGFSLKLPPSATQQSSSGRPTSAMYDLYTAGGFAYVVEVTPTPSDALASTMIEQTIQADMREAAKLGATTRWEATSKQGDLFKGFTGPVQFSTTDAGHAAVIKAIGGDRGVYSVALAPLGDESAPVLRISVMGKANREREVVAMAKTVSSMVTTSSRSAVLVPTPKPAPTPPRPIAPRPVPTPKPKPWPVLKSGEIELAGTVESISKDGKTVMMTVGTVKVIGQELIALSPMRPKRVLLKSKLGWLTQGLYVHLIGENSGVGKPIQADAMEQTPAPAPNPSPPGPIPPA